MHGFDLCSHDARDDSPRDMLRAAELALIDLDGCLVFGGRAHPAAAALLKSLEGRYAIVSNNSTHTPEGLAILLSGEGPEVPPERILLAGSLMIDSLAQSANRATFFLARPAIVERARDHGVRFGDERGADVVALARDTTLTYEKILGAVALLSRGAEFVVSNPDLTHPGCNRVPIPETGALAALFQACVPFAVPQIVGKPSPRIFHEALRRFAATSAGTIVIGDNPATDGAGAKAAGMRAVLVGRGQVHASIADLVG